MVALGGRGGRAGRRARNEFKDPKTEYSIALDIQREDGLGYWGGTATRKPSLGGGLVDWSNFTRLGSIERELFIDSVILPHLRFDAGNEEQPVLLCSGEVLVTFFGPRSVTEMAGQLSILRASAEIRADRLAEISLQQDDIVSFFSRAFRLDETQNEWAVDLMHVMDRLGALMTLPIKLHFAVPRPVDFSPYLQPLIDTPNHPSWPSGHATIAFGIATVLAGLMTAEEGKTYSVAHILKEPHKSILPLFHIAQRVADNRTVAGVHFPDDSLAGAVTGVALGEFLVNWLNGGKQTPQHTATATFDTDFTLENVRTALAAGTGSIQLPKSLEPKHVLRQLWEKARSRIGAIA